MDPKEDQKDLVAKLEAAQGQITSLTSERDQARTQLTAVTGERDQARTQLTAVTGERDQARTELTTVKGQVTSLTAERDQAKNERATAVAQLGESNLKVTKLEASQKDFDVRLSTELVKHGVRMNAVTLPISDTKSDGTKMTATEQVIAAKQAGVK